MICAKQVKTADRHQQTAAYALDVMKSSPIAEYVTDVILYGSCGRGDDTWESDVDLLLVLDALKKEEINQELHFELIRLRTDVSPKDMTLPEADLHVAYEDAFQNSDSIFYQNVRKDGKTIWM